MATIILLPGMDGSGSLFEDFIASLPSGVEAMVVKYPPDRALDYAELEALARAALPIQGPFHGNCQARRVTCAAARCSVGRCRRPPIQR